MSLKCTMNRVILASASPRRRELLGKIFATFEVIPSGAEENVSVTEPSKVVEELSLLKAKDIFDKQEKTEGLLVVGSDTIVAYDGQILGKPTDTDHAFAMLKELQGNTHQVYTGVTLCAVKDGKEVIKTFHECTDVTFYSMTDEELWDYVWTKENGGRLQNGDGECPLECMDKAGSYGIQGYGAVLVEKICGDYNNVVGLPVARLAREIKRL